MTKRATREAHPVAGTCAALVFVYVILALTVFSFRHPWMTQTENLLYIGRALTFGTVAYDEARPR